MAYQDDIDALNAAVAALEAQTSTLTNQQAQLDSAKAILDDLSVPDYTTLSPLKADVSTALATLVTNVSG